MNWSQIIAAQRAKVNNLFDRLTGARPDRMGALREAYEQECACLRAMGSVLIAASC
ncbi:hypothetical protein [Burkholderia cenocepacia]|uniref:hypothetical protein n=1 Tax=Burkholderia cenocepacia TaxID=95486 RepID=UPI0028751BEE|nr:hypothetical protein [Burkholderia cenocepacia]MDS0801749.1 hypothetical protein [Burkholderia cenocepacia]